MTNNMIDIPHIEVYLLWKISQGFDKSVGIPQAVLQKQEWKKLDIHSFNLLIRYPNIYLNTEQKSNMMIKL